MVKTKLVVFLGTCLVATLFIRPAFANPLLGDIDGDGDVDINDVVLAASQYRLTPESAGYNATIVEKADLAAPFNGIINIYDLVTLIFHYTGSL